MILPPEIRRYPDKILPTSPNTVLSSFLAVAVKKAYKVMAMGMRNIESQKDPRYWMASLSY